MASDHHVAKPVSTGLLSMVVRTPLAIASALATQIMKSAVHQFLADGIKWGCLVLVEVQPDGSPVKETSFGEPKETAVANSRPVAVLNLLNPDNFYIRVATSADIGFAEAYIAQDFALDHPEDLLSIFNVLILNRDAKKLSTSRLVLSNLGAYVNRAVHVLNANSIAGSRKNIEAHYDLSNELFATFLGKSWTYSCAYFGPEDAKPETDTSTAALDSAQFAKLDMIIQKARLNADCHVLEIGCGWGEFAIRAAKQVGCRVTGITLSAQQMSLAKSRAADAGVADKVQFEIADYRTLTQRGAAVYDRIISIEMLEAVGHEFLGQYFQVLDSVLKPNGLVVLQVITTPEYRYEEYRTSVDFVQKHIFPGGICPSLQALVNAMAGNSRFSLEHAENIGPHYATTLREWRRRFMESANMGLVKAAGFDDFFIRKWIYYFCYCEAGFASRTLSTMQLVLTRPGNKLPMNGQPVLNS